MTDDDYDALSQKQLASIKRDMRISLEDAAVRATHKVMAELETEQEPVAWGFQNSAITGSNRWMMLREDIPTDDQYGGALWTPLYTAPPQRKPLTEEQAKNLLRIGPVHAPDGVVTRTPLAYRKELLETALWALRRAEAAHGIGDKT